MKNNSTVGFGAALLLWSQMVFCVSSSQVALDVVVESVARVEIYYQGSPVMDNGIEFPLPVHGLSQKLERESSFIYLVGNVDQADIVFDETQFILPQLRGGETSIKLNGYFLLQNRQSSATEILRVPVLKSISQGTAKNGVKVRFVSQDTAKNYLVGDYANIFTLLITPVI